MWATVLSWAAKLWPIIWRFVAPLLEGRLRQDLEFVLPFAARMVAAVENAYSYQNRLGPEKRLAALRLVRAEIVAADRTREVPDSTVNLAIELALKSLQSGLIAAPKGATSNGDDT